MAYDFLLEFLLIIDSVSILYYDIRYRIIPDLFVLFLLILGILHYSLTYHHMLCVVILGGGGALLKIGMEKILNRPALGWGDIKLAGALGIGMEPEQISLFLICAGLVGCVWGLFHKVFLKEHLFPFAPSLMTGFLLTSRFLV